LKLKVFNFLLECIEVLIKVSLNPMASFPQPCLRDIPHKGCDKPLNLIGLNGSKFKSPNERAPDIGGIPSNILLERIF
jgi:hypothetical protein